MFEHRSKPLIPPSAFYRRMLLYVCVSLGLLFFSLVIGIIGYHYFENLSMIDAFLNAAMIMGGMGEVNELHTDGAKIFAGIYALYCGLILLVAAGLLIAPIFHRFLHKFHLDIADADS